MSHLLKLTLWTLALTCIVLPATSRGQIAVEILDSPNEVFRYEPVYVTFEVRNEGQVPLVIPSDQCPSEGASLEAEGPTGETRRSYHLSVCTSRNSRWLAPGERRLFFRNVILDSAGKNEVVAILRSPGECLGRPSGPHREMVQPGRKTEWGPQHYDCWLGEASSEPVSVMVRVPSDEADAAAALFLELQPSNWKLKFRLGFRDLVERFPFSHYTYAAHDAAGGGQLMLDAIQLQPENPLNPWAAGAAAEAFIRMDSGCPPASDPWSPEDRERLQRTLATSPPPAPVADYLRQLEAELSSEACKTVREGDHGSADDAVTQEN